MINATADELRPHRGKWVVVKDGKVVISSDSFGESIEQLREMVDILPADSLFRVPLNPEEDFHAEH